MKKIIFALFIAIFSISTCYALEDESVVYYRTDYNIYGDYIGTVEVSEEEYNSDVMTLSSVSYTTEYKKLAIETSNGTATLTLTWKQDPKVKSYDVIAIRGENVTFGSSVTGAQKYTLDGTTGYYYYYASTTNTQVFSNGVGVSVNLVDDGTDYVVTLKLTYTTSSGTSKIYGSYQHAITGVTLTQSKNYTLSSEGYGNVILFGSSAKSCYDKMGGVSVTV